MRNREYKYNYYFGGGREELFNLEIDPNECFNLMESSLNEKDEAEKEKLKLSLISYETKWGLPGTIENNSFIVLEPYVPNPYRNSAFPIFQEKLMKKDDRNTMNHHFDEIISVIKDESVVNLSDLDLKNWQVNGNYSSEEIDTLLEKERDNRAYKLKTNSV